MVSLLSSEGEMWNSLYKSASKMQSLYLSVFPFFITWISLWLLAWLLPWQQCPNHIFRHCQQNWWLEREQSWDFFFKWWCWFILVHHGHLKFWKEQGSTHTYEKPSKEGTTVTHSFWYDFASLLFAQRISPLLPQVISIAPEEAEAIYQVLCITHEEAEVKRVVQIK